MNFKTMSLIGAVALALPTLGMADPDDDTLVINGDIAITTKAPAPAHLSDSLDEVMSGWHFRSDETQAMEMDDFDNPGMILSNRALKSGMRLTVAKASPAQAVTVLQRKWLV